MRVLLLIFLIIPFLVVGQANMKHIKNPGTKKTKKCDRYFKVDRQLPADLRYSVHLIDGKIIFHFPSKEAFNKLFKSRFDGIAIDIIHRDQYDCVEGNTLANSWAYKGELLTPVFKKDFRKRLKIERDGGVSIDFGPLPPHYNSQNTEYNLLVIQKKYLCDYNTFSYLDYNQWQLLKTGLFRDSINESMQEEVKLLKRLNFEIPFAKSRHLYDSIDIKPLYDSLNLSEYFIDSIKIKAYSSVEGDFEFNQRLQKARATSIVKGLQAFQKPHIYFRVSTAENWEGFYSDIQGTKYQDFSKLPQATIRQLLTDHADKDELESILSGHRKATIEMNLSRRISVNPDPDELVQFFGQAVARKEVNQALYIQNLLFEVTKNDDLPTDFLGRLEIPELSVFGPLMINKLVFQIEEGIGSIDEHIAAFEQLSQLIPENDQIKYNLAVLKLRRSDSFYFAKEKESIRKLINTIRLKNHESLIIRLKINYHLLRTEFYDRRMEYRERNKSLRYIHANYGELDLSDKERLYTARFFSTYNQFDWSANILGKRAYDHDAPAKLIDYYLRITIHDHRKLNSSKYKALLLSTAEYHPNTFCNLFATKALGGHTFQLLDDERLSVLYCNYCH